MGDLVAGVVAADTVTRPTDAWNHAVLVAGSHGGVYAAYCAVKAGVRGVILNDAGRGMDDAGIGGLDYCEALGIPYAAIDTMSARIGNGDDMLARGIISAANRTAEALGVRSGMPCAEAAAAMTRAVLSGKPVPAYEEARFEFPAGPGGRRVVLVDSISLVGPGDVGQVVVSGSHGGILGSEKAAAMKIDGYAAFFNDAGGGADDGGFSRLPALDERGIAAGTVGAMTARIGDARSSYEHGVLSRVNDTARRLGGAEGMALKAFCERLTA
ncbi:hypothetical protein [Thalassobaculum sp.]|uniref:hypothetical protein n=1 Tax=Thalassobaculum sp. TaxID=2022740 RepID=UPI0032F08D07